MVKIEQRKVNQHRTDLVISTKNISLRVVDKIELPPLQQRLDLSEFWAAVRIAAKYQQKQIEHKRSLKLAQANAAHLAEHRNDLSKLSLIRIV